MKNNQSSTEQRRWEQHHLRMAVPCLRKFQGCFNDLCKAKDLIAEATKCIRCQHKERQEPDNRDLHTQVDKLIIQILDDYMELSSQLDICETTNAEGNE